MTFDKQARKLSNLQKLCRNVAFLGRLKDQAGTSTGMLWSSKLANQTLATVNTKVVKVSRLAMGCTGRHLAGLHQGLEACN